MSRMKQGWFLMASLTAMALGFLMTIWAIYDANGYADWRYWLGSFIYLAGFVWASCFAFTLIAQDKVPSM